MPSDSILFYDQSFPELLKSEAEKLLLEKLSLGEAFVSADSYSYLLYNDLHKYVGKIYRFLDSPPVGKLKQIETILDGKKITHANIISIKTAHPVFKFGWEINEYIEGGTARSLRNSGKLADRDYFVALGKLLKQTLTVTFDYFGMIHNEQRFKTFSELVKYEFKEQDLVDFPEEYAHSKMIFVRAKKVILESIDKFDWGSPRLVHDDANDNNVMWRGGNPMLLDWTDSLAAPEIREFACLTFRYDRPVLQFIEEGYGMTIDRDQLRIHQMMRFIKLGRFFCLENRDVAQLMTMTDRLEGLLTRKEPYGI